MEAFTVVWQPELKVWNREERAIRRRRLYRIKRDSKERLVRHKWSTTVLQPLRILHSS